MSQPLMRDRMVEYVRDLQDRIITAFEKLDPNAPAFKRDSWTRAQGGYGTSGVFAVPHTAQADAVPPTTVLEKAGVNVSVVNGQLPPAAIKQMRVEHSSIPYDPNTTATLPFFATGVSLVIHPRNPHAPTVHANYRYFEITESEDKEKGPGKVLAWWFGGGCDLTPSYLYENDALHFHKTLKDACDPHGAAIYPAFKKWCDEYFFISHRGESRGIGGIFFDDLCDGKHARFADRTAHPNDPEAIFAFLRSAGDAFIPSYLPILERRVNMPFTPEERRWQLLRRGRYVEFNLVHDRGTKFGLATPGARVESILMSLPETARWEYMSDMGTEEGTEEYKLMQVLKTPREWL